MIPVIKPIACKQGTICISSGLGGGGGRERERMRGGGGGGVRQ